MLLAVMDFCAPVKPNYGRKIKLGVLFRLHLDSTSQFGELEPVVFINFELDGVLPFGS